MTVLVQPQPYAPSKNTRPAFDLGLVLALVSECTLNCFVQMLLCLD